LNGIGCAVKVKPIVLIAAIGKNRISEDFIGSSFREDCMMKVNML
jgi:hypothetical protein